MAPSLRALNRTLLKRQLLLARARLGVGAALTSLVGMQAQVPLAPYVGLWSRIEGFRPGGLSAQIKKRACVRVALQRGTLHLVTARDALSLRPLLQPVFDRGLAGVYGRRLAAVDLGRLARRARALLEARPLTAAELGAALRVDFPRADAEALAAAARGVLALVQVPPRGLWGAPGKAAHTTAEHWLGKPLRAGTLDSLVLRYLAAFGPASVRDAEKWSGLSGLRKVFARLDLRDDGGGLFDVPGGRLADEDAPAPPRFLPDYDNVLLAHADRSRILDWADKPRISAGNGLLACVLVDGFAAATWRVEEGALRIAPFRPLTKADRDAVAAEGGALLSFLAPDERRRRVEFG